MFKIAGIDIENNKKSIIIAIAIAFSTLFICARIVKSHKDQGRNIERSIKDQYEKNALRSDLEKIDKINREYTKYFYDSITQDTLRSIISSLARESNVDIISIRPVGTDQIGIVQKESLDIAISCTYNQLGVFISKIENLEKITKIESFSAEGVSVFRVQDIKSEEAQKEFLESDTQLSVSMIVSGYSTRG